MIKDKPYCICAEIGRDDTKRHNKQSAVRFVALDINNNPTKYIIRPCRNHVKNYREATHNWKELPREKPVANAF